MSLDLRALRCIAASQLNMRVSICLVLLASYCHWLSANSGNRVLSEPPAAVAGA
jgi:hypothetical protein